MKYVMYVVFLYILYFRPVEIGLAKMARTGCPGLPEAGL